MTNIEALEAAINVPGLNANTLEKACIDADITSGALYTKAEKATVNTAAIAVLRSLIVSSEKEGGYAYNISAEALQARIKFLKDGDTDNRPTITALDRW